MKVLWERHKGLSDDPVKFASKEAGWLLKRVLAEDPRTFEMREGPDIRQYRWVADIIIPDQSGTKTPVL